MMLRGQHQRVYQKDLACKKYTREGYKHIIGGSCNAQMTSELIKEYCKVDKESMKMLMIAYYKFKYSARTYHKFLRVARTFVDMDGEERILKCYIIKALMCREIEKEQVTMFVVQNMDRKILYIWLSKINGVGPVLAGKLIEFF